jgi:hypothetical protein
MAEDQAESPVEQPMTTFLLRHLRRVGWAEVARPYPDRGPLDEAAWYNGTVLIHGAGLGAIVAANAEGLRVAVGSGASALFVPWSEVPVSARRGWVDTTIQFATKAAPCLPLVIRLEDADADAVLGAAGVEVPARRWPWGPSLWVAGSIGLLVALFVAALLLRPR